jgi:transposase
MFPAIENPTSCEIRAAVIRFFHAKNMSSTEIYRHSYAIYGQNVMSEGPVRQWNRMFKDGRTNVHDEERSGRPAICSE